MRIRSPRPRNSRVQGSKGGENREAENWRRVHKFLCICQKRRFNKVESFAVEHWRRAIDASVHCEMFNTATQNKNKVGTRSRASMDMRTDIPMHAVIG